ncbi:MAG: hypothetical protein DPW16_16635 [Chloroflexi bacterium]|nr:hypothetical protein [Chloroflexota bacterium]
MDSVSLTVAQQKKFLCGCLSIGLVGSCLFVFIAYIGPEFFQDDYTTFQAKRWLNKTQDKIAEWADKDSLIEKTEEPQVSLGGTMQCVYGSGHMDFGSNRPFTEIVSEFTRELLNEGFKENKTLSTEDDKVFYLPDEDWTRQISVSRENLDSTNFVTEYSVYISFREKRCAP